MTVFASKQAFGIYISYFLHSMQNCLPSSEGNIMKMSMRNCPKLYKKRSGKVRTTCCSGFIAYKTLKYMSPSSPSPHLVHSVPNSTACLLYLFFVFSLFLPHFSCKLYFISASFHFHIAFLPPLLLVS